ncbi:hypothetical protein ONE63_011350 [Megalurothrips usitatus]|uniref:Uncharacterized protein n=1 Tax=Megalurothrips usitatus TaxID=439358 RepID=A0AAV7X2X6_9NEOP|nr:hypothetical protein ONE63_011350 [Megalurothrips usitatus]
MEDGELGKAEKGVTESMPSMMLANHLSLSQSGQMLTEQHAGESETSQSPIQLETPSWVEWFDLLEKIHKIFDIISALLEGLGAADFSLQVKPLVPAGCPKLALDGVLRTSSILEWRLFLRRRELSCEESLSESVRGELDMNIVFRLPVAATNAWQVRNGVNKEMQDGD